MQDVARWLRAIGFDARFGRARSWPAPALFWLGVAALAGGCAYYRAWQLVPAGPTLFLVAVTLVAALLCALMTWLGRCQPATALLWVALAALAYFAGIGPSLAVVLIGLAALGIGTALVPATWSARASLSLVAGLAVLCGVDGWLLPFPLHLRAVCLAVLLVIIVWRRRAIGAVLRPVAANWSRAVARARWPAALALLAVFVASTGAWLPTILFDDLGHHLALPTQLAELGYYQMNLGTNMWALSAWASDVAQGMAQVLAGAESRGVVDALWFALSCALTWELCRALRLRPAMRWLAIALFAALPLTMHLLGSMQTEGPTVAVMLALACVIARKGTTTTRHSRAGGNPVHSRRWIDSPLLRLALRAVGSADVRSGILPPQSAFAGMTKKSTFRKPQADGRQLLLLGALFGLLIGLKVSDVWFAGPLGLWFLLRNRGRLAWRSLPWAVLLAVIVGGSSYAYAWVLAGNPTLPLFNGVFHSPWYPAVNYHDARWNAGFHWNIVWNLVFHSGRYTEPGTTDPVFVLVALAGSFLVALTKPRARALALVGVVALLLPLSQIQYFRYAWPALALLVPAMLCSVPARRAGRHAQVARGVLWVLVALSLACASGVGWQLKHGALRTLVTSGRHGVLARFAPERLALDAIDHRYGASARTLILIRNSPFAAQLAGRGFVVGPYDPTLRRWATRARASDKLSRWQALFARSGANLLVTRERHVSAGLMQAIRARHGTRVITRGNVDVWRLPPTRGAQFTRSKRGGWLGRFDVAGAPPGDTLVRAHVRFACSAPATRRGHITVHWIAKSNQATGADHWAWAYCRADHVASAAAVLRVPGRVTSLQVTATPSAPTAMRLKPLGAKASIRRDLTARRNLARRVQRAFHIPQRVLALVRQLTP